MKIKFNDNVEVAAIQVNGQGRYFQGNQRDSLEFVFPKAAYPFDTLDGYFADKNKTKKITLIDETDPTNPISYIHDDYVLRISMSLAPVVITPATSNTPEVTEERVSVIMAQQTYIEKQLEAILG